jgi:hypothetical protein
MMELLQSLNIWAVVTATVVYFLLGALWYSLLFSKAWMKLRGITEEDIGEPNPMMFVWTFLLQLVAVASLALFLQAMGANSLMHGAVIGFGAGAGLVFTLTGTTGIFSNTSLGLHLIDNGYHVLGLTLAGMILGVW